MSRVESTLRTLRSSVLTSRGAGLLFVALTAVNLGNFGFHVVVSRLLTPDAYGTLVAMLGIVLVLTVPLNAMQVAVTRETAIRRAARGDEEFRLDGLVVRSAVAGLAAFVLFCLAAPVLKSFLHLRTISPVLVVGAFLVPAVTELGPKGVLLGQQRFALVAVGVLAGVIARLAVGVALAGTALAVTGALVGTVVGEGVTCVIFLFAVRSCFGVRSRPRLEVRVRDAARAIAAFGGYWVFASLDVVLARHFLPARQAGYYGAAATAARAAQFLPAAVTIVAFPFFAETEGRGAGARRALWHALAAVAVLGLGTAGCIALLPHLFVGVLFGSTYSVSSTIVGVLAVSAGLSGLVSVLVYFHLASGRRASLLPWAGCAAAVLLVTAVHGSPQDIAHVMLATTAGLLAVMLISARGSAASSELADLRSQHRQLWDLEAPDLDVTVVVPYYNPGPRLRANLERLVAVLQEAAVTFEIIAVSDGTNDGSELSIRGLRDDVIRQVDLPFNCGKGEALRIGLSGGRGRYLGFIDADGDLDPALVTPFLTLMRLYEPDVVLGSKRHPMSQLRYPPLRRFYSWSYQQLIRVLFRLKVRDTQTGLKLIRRQVAAEVLPRMLEKRFAFDLELFVVARRLGFDRFFEAPVRIDYGFTSSISVRAVRGMLIDTLAIFYRLRLRRWYDRPIPAQTLQLDVAAATAVLHETNV